MLFGCLGAKNMDRALILAIFDLFFIFGLIVFLYVVGLSYWKPYWLDKWRKPCYKFTKQGIVFLVRALFGLWSCLDTQYRYSEIDLTNRTASRFKYLTCLILFFPLDNLDLEGLTWKFSDGTVLREITNHELIQHFEGMFYVVSIEGAISIDHLYTIAWMAT